MKETTVYLTTFVQSAQAIRCDHCKNMIRPMRFRMGGPARQRYVLINLRENGRWVAMLRLHPECYDAAGQPHGQPQERKARAFAKR